MNGAVCVEAIVKIAAWDGRLQVGLHHLDRATFDALQPRAVRFHEIPGAPFWSGVVRSTKTLRLTAFTNEPPAGES